MAKYFGLPQAERSSGEQRRLGRTIKEVQVQKQVK